MNKEVEELLRAYNFLFFCEAEIDPPTLRDSGLNLESISIISEVILKVKQTIKESAAQLIPSVQLKSLIFEIGKAIGAVTKIEGEEENEEGALVENDTDTYRNFLFYLIDVLSSRIDNKSVQFMESLASDQILEPFKEELFWARDRQNALRREQLFNQPTWEQTLSVLRNGSPINVSDLLHFVVDHIQSLQKEISCNNVDLYKLFWNEDEFSHLKDPKIEESARDVLVQLLRPYLQAHGIRVEPEGHMAKDNRADIVITINKFKLPVELKRDVHKKVWTAWDEQLDKLYTSNPEANNLGLYLVFWYGEKRKGNITKPPGNFELPKTAAEMANIFQEIVPNLRKDRIKTIVLDVSGDINVTDNASEIANKIKNHIEQKEIFLNPNITIADLARNIDEQEHKVSQAIIGTLKFNSFKQMLKFYRIEHAKNLLRNPSYEQSSILTIAKECGFSSVDPFKKAFRDLIGITPTQYRKADSRSNS